MTSAVAIANGLLRSCLAAALALAWLLLAGAPAAAAVTDVNVTEPKADAVIGKAVALEAIVDRSFSPDNERVEVHTRLLNAKNEPLSDKVLLLVADEEPLPPRDNQPPGSDRLRFTGLIDPYNLAWLQQGGIARNAEYRLQYRAVARYGDDGPVRETEWETTAFWLNAPPPEPGPPAAGVLDPAAKRLQVAWHPNPAPDLIGYALERRSDGGQWETAAAEVGPGTTQITDTVAEYGTYRYRVVAYRSGAQPPPKEEPPADGDVSDQTADGTGQQEEGKQEAKPRSAVSAASAPVTIGPPASPAPRGQDGGGPGTSDGGDGGRGDTGGGVPPVPSNSNTSGQPAPQPFAPQSPNVAAPPGFDDTYKGPLSYGVEPNEVTERVPVEVAQGGSGDDTLTVFDRAIDQTRVLPPVAGGLILVVSAAHVLRYLHE